MIVLDASAAIALLLDRPIEVASRIRARIDSTSESVSAPHLVDLEVTQALRRLVIRGETSNERAEDALGKLPGLPAIRYPHWPLLSRIWELRHNFSAYVALSEALDAPLLTSDRRLAAASGHRARIEVF